MKGSQTLTVTANSINIPQEKENSVALLLSSSSLHHRAEEFGDTYVVFMFHKVFLCTRCPETFKAVLVHGNQRKFPKEDLGLGYIFRKRYVCR